MLKTDKEREICKRYSAVHPDGKVHCCECPLITNDSELLCRANSHYDEHQHLWVPDDDYYDKKY